MRDAEFRKEEKRRFIEDMDGFVKKFYPDCIISKRKVASTKEVIMVGYMLRDGDQYSIVEGSTRFIQETNYLDKDEALNRFLTSLPYQG